MSPGGRALVRLADRIRAEGEPLALRDEWSSTGSATGGRPGYRDGDPRFGELAAAGPRTAGDPDRYAFVVEAIREGYLCHYGTSRLLEMPEPDLALLTGDLLYAIGLSELSGLDDLESTGILSDLIRVAADLQAAAEPDRAAALWSVQIIALSCGKPDRYEARLEAVAEGDPAALEALFEWAKSTADRVGTGSEFRKGSERIHFRPSNL